MNDQTGRRSKRAPKPPPMDPQEQAEQHRRVLSLRRQRLTWARIAEIMGFADPSGAWRCYRNAVADIPKEERNEMIAAECAALDAVQRAAWTGAKTGDPKAITAFVKVLERRASLLGLDAKKQLQVNLVETEEWTEVKDKLLGALEKHPEAQQAVAAALRGI